MVEITTSESYTTELLDGHKNNPRIYRFCNRPPLLDQRKIFELNKNKAKKYKLIYSLIHKWEKNINTLVRKNWYVIWTIVHYVSPFSGQEFDEYTNHYTIKDLNAGNVAV